MNLNDRFQRFGAERTRLLERLHGASPEALKKKPGPGRWSALEIVEHLVLSERIVLGNFAEVPALLAAAERKRRPIRYFLVASILRLRIPVRAPSRAMVPSGSHELAELRELWDQSHVWLATLLKQLSPLELRRPLFVHPVAGALTFAQALHLNEMHLAIHSRQIERAIAS